MGHSKPPIQGKLIGTQMLPVLPTVMDTTREAFQSSFRADPVTLPWLVYRQLLGQSFPKPEWQLVGMLLTLPSRLFLTGVDLGYILHFTSDSKRSKNLNIHSIAGPNSNHVKISRFRGCQLLVAGHVGQGLFWAHVLPALLVPVFLCFFFPRNLFSVE